MAAPRQAGKAPPFWAPPSARGRRLGPSRAGGSAHSGAGLFGAAHLGAAFMLALFGLLPLAPLAASGRAEEEPRETVRDAWVLSVTQFDLSALSPGRRMAGEVIARSLVERLGEVSYRLRLSPELAFYEGYEWRRYVQATAQALARRQNDRALLLFRGDPGWRYRRDLRRIDEDIERLREELARREAERPIVNPEPAFELSQANLGGAFPAPPAPGGERRFARAQGADAFLAGEVREFHGRFFVRLRLYVLYLDAFAFEDDVIFSMDDIGGAVSEIATALASALSGNPPARLAIRAYPPGAQILVNLGYAGTGEAPAAYRPPGTVSIAVAAEGHAPETVELYVAPGELTEVEIALGPLPMAEVAILSPEAPGAAVYHGALFVGETPLAMLLPIGSLAYVSLEGPGGERARAVVAAPPMPGEAFDFSFRLSMPPPAGARRVNNARARFYWAWGGLWGTIIAAWISSGIRNDRSAALARGGSPELFAAAQRAQAVSTGSMILLAPAIGYWVFEMSRYLGAANAGAVRIARRDR